MSSIDVRDSLAYYDSMHHTFRSQDSEKSSDYVFDDEALDTFMHKVEDLAVATRFLSGGLFWYPFVMMFRLFKAFAAQPRLAVVTQTLVAAAVDVAHFGVTFLSVFFTYTVSGVALFGREIDDFTTFPRACNACMRVILGDFDWDALTTVGRQEAGLWFWSFTFLIIHIMLNMLLSIIMDTYMDVKGPSGSAETIFSQAKEIYRRWRGKRHKTRLDLEDILKCLDTSTLDEADLQGADDIINIKTLMQMVEGLKTAQGNRVLNEAQILMDKEWKVNISVSEAMTKIQELEIKGHQIHQAVSELFELSMLVAHQQKVAHQQSANVHTHTSTVTRGAGMSSKKALLTSLEKDMQTTAEVSEAMFADVLGTLTHLGHRCQDLQLHADGAKEAVAQLESRLSEVEREVSLACGITPINSNGQEVVHVRRLKTADLTPKM